MASYAVEHERDVRPGRPAKVCVHLGGEFDVTPLVDVLSLGEDLVSVVVGHSVGPFNVKLECTVPTYGDVVGTAGRLFQHVGRWLVKNGHRPLLISRDRLSASSGYVWV